MGVADDQPHASEPAGLQRPQEPGPEGQPGRENDPGDRFPGPRFGRTNARTDDFPPASGVGSDGDYSVSYQPSKYRMHWHGSR